MCAAAAAATRVRLTCANSERADNSPPSIRCRVHPPVSLEPILGNLHLLKIAHPIAVLAVLGACGGDDQTSSMTHNEPNGTANSAPVIGGTPSSEAHVGVPYEFVPETSDADEDLLTFAIDNRPDWATFNSTTGRLSGTPTTSHAGVYANIVISVSDANLTRSLNPFSIMVTSSVSGGSVTLSWRAPTKNTDGSILTNLAGYRVHYGTAPGNYTESVQLSGHEMTSVVIEDLRPAHWYFTVTAYNSVGVESDLSNPASKLIQ